MAHIRSTVLTATPPISLSGGLDLITSTNMKPPGRLIACKNYEGVAKGYGRIDGFERFDGHPKPSEASYWYVTFGTGTAAISLGQTVTDATSGATGKALIDAVVTSGSYGGGNAVGYLVLTAVSGTFGSGHNLQVGGVTKVVSTAAAVQRGALNDTDDTTWYRSAVTTARALINTVPGSGNILGVWAYNGTIYAFRNDAGGTAAVMHKSTTAGWSAVSLGYSVPFTSSGATAIAVGNTVTGAASAASAVITRVVIRTGSWAAGNAAGILVFAGYSAGGPFTNGENLQVGGVTRAVASAASSAITLLPNGRYEFENCNFGGSTSTYRMYGCDGVNKAFEFDGTVFVPLATGMTTDAPKHIKAHKFHLFLAFPKGSIQHSSIRDPYAYSPVTGAEEIGMGQEITGFIGPYAEALIVLCKSKIGILYGDDVDTFNLKPLQEKAGGIEWTGQMVGYPLCMDDRGLRNISTTNAFGDFNIGTLTNFVQPLLELKKKLGVTAVASVCVKAKDQYRLFFSDNSFMSIYFGRNIVKGTPEAYFCDLGKRVYAICAVELTESGDDVVMFGSDDGYVYQMDAGTSFDGSEIEAYARTAYCNDRRPTQNKAWKKAKLEIDAAPTAAISGTAEFDYANWQQPPNMSQDFSITGGGLIFDLSRFDDAYWDGGDVGVAYMDLEGEGANVSLAILSRATWEKPHVLQGLTYHWSPRGMQR
jgi:hypothetical protein